MLLLVPGHLGSPGQRAVKRVYVSTSSSQKPASSLSAADSKVTALCKRDYYYYYQRHLIIRVPSQCNLASLLKISMLHLFWTYAVFWGRIEVFCILLDTISTLSDNTVR